MDINIPESRVFGNPLIPKKKFLTLREGTKYMSRILISFYKIHFFKNSVLVPRLKSEKNGFFFAFLPLLIRVFGRGLNLEVFIKGGILKVSFINEKKRQRVPPNLIFLKKSSKINIFKNWSTYHWQNLMLVLSRYIIILYSANKKTQDFITFSHI